MIHTRIDCASQTIAEAIIDAEIAIADGLQPEDLPVLQRCLRTIGSQTTELDDIILDVDAARRCLSVGREEVFDDRFKARDRAVQRARAEQTEAARGGIPVAAGSAVLANR